MQIVDEKSFRIILASENLTFRTNLASKLRIEGFNIELANGGFHLLHLIEKEEINLVIINEHLNDMPANEIISLLRSAKSKIELPIIYISKDKSEEEICEYIFVGANEYIVQGNNFGPIIERVRKYFAALNPT